MMGRSVEMAFLADVISDSKTSGVLVAGRAGVGKTRLIREVIDTVHGVHAELVTATESVRPLPLGPFSHLLPDEGALPDPVDLLAVLGRHLQQRAHGQPIVLAVDDIHLLDGLSAALIEYVTARDLGTVLLTLRSGEPVPDGLKRLCGPEGVPRLELQALARPEFDQMIEEALGGVVESMSLERIWDATQGNVLFARELLTDTVEAGELREVEGVWQWSGGLGGALRLREMIESRVRGINDPSRQFLELLALSEPISLGHAESVTPQDTLLELERRGLIALSDEGHLVRFSHPLFREVLRAALPSLRHRELCRRLVRLLQGEARTAAELLKLAILWEGSGETVDDEVLAQAAHAALQFSDFALAEHFALAARRQRSTMGVELDLGLALLGQHRFAAAADVLITLVDREADDPSRERLVDGIGLTVGHGLGQIHNALRLMERIEGTISDPLLRALAQCHRATLLSFACRYEEAIELGTRARAHTDDDAIHVRSLTSVAASLVMVGRIDEALALTTEGLDRALRVSKVLPRAPSWAFTTRCTALAFAGRISEAIGLIDAALATPGLSSETRARANVYRSRFLLFLGKPASALRGFKDAAFSLRSSPVEASWCLALNAESEALLGNLEAAASARTEARDLSGTDQWTFQVDERRALAWVDAQAGHLTRAISALWDAANLARDRNQRCFEINILEDLMRLGTTDAIDRVNHLVPQVDGALADAIGVHARALDRHDGATYEEAARAFASLGSNIVASELWASAAASYRQEGLAARATKAASHAALATSLSEGSTTRMRVDVGAVEPLTHRQREIALLAANGVDNSDIASSLSLSRRTVESHLYAVFSKLGISSREEIKEALVQREHE